MHLQLVNYTDRFGNTYVDAAAVIQGIQTPIPPDGTVRTLIRVYKDIDAEAAGSDFLFTEERPLDFNPFQAGAQNAAYTALEATGGIYFNGTVVP